MSGSGFKTFVDGDVLTAAEVNGYLMKQTVVYYATSTARDVDTPYEGKIVYLADSNKMQFYTGTAWIDMQDVQIFNNKGDLVAGTGADTRTRLSVGSDEQRLVADSGETTGLKYVADTTNYAIGSKGDLLVGTAADTLVNLAVGTDGHVLTADSGETSGVKWAAAAGGGGLVLIDSASPSSAASVSFDGVFTATYTSYKIVWYLVGSGTTNLEFRFRASNADLTGADYYWQYLRADGATISGDDSDSKTKFETFQNVRASGTGAEMNIFGALESLPTWATVKGVDPGNAGVLYDGAGQYNPSTAVDGFTLFPVSGTITGQINVYGYED